MRRNSFWSAFIALIPLLAGMFWLADFARRRMRAQKLFDASRERIGRVKVADVIEREAEDELSREELLARLPERTRYYDQCRYELARACIPASLRSARFLDAGCGDGYVIQETRKMFPAQFIKFYGLDISHFKTERARQRLGAAAEIAVANLEGLPFLDNSFDVILCTEVLEHLLKVGPGVAELARVCRPGGRVIFSTPSKQPMFFSYANPLTWLEAVVGLFDPALLPPFHNLERPHDPNSVVHRAFTIRELENELRAFQTVTIVSTHFRLPGPLYRIIKLPHRLARIETFLARIPVIRLLGETLIVCAIKA